MSDRTNDNREDREPVLKKIFLVFAFVLLLIPAVISICLGIRMYRLEDQVVQLREELADTKEETASAQAQGGGADDAQAGSQGEAEDAAGSEPDMLTEEDSIRAWEEQERENPPSESTGSGIRKVYLTFDDGPSIYTDDILDILKEYDVKATFFVVGEGKEDYEDAYRRILEEGHTLGMHSYSHVYRDIYKSKEAFIMDVNRLQDYLYEVTGVYPEVYRFPGGSSNRVSTVNMQELEDYLSEIGITWYDWNISGGDATGHLSKGQIVSNCTANLRKYADAVILLHDSGDKRSTVEALPEIIERIKEMEDTVIVPITRDTIPIQHGK